MQVSPETQQAERFYDIKRIGGLSQDGVFVYKLPEGSFDYLNAAFTGIFGVTRDNVMAQSRLLLDFVMSEDRHYLQQRFADLISTGCITNTEFRIRLSSGIVKHISCDAYLLEEGEYVAGFVKDVSRMKEHENYMINYGAKKDTLLDMITHNLHGPLSLSENLIQNAQKSYQGQQYDAIHNHLRMIQDVTRECIEIVNNLLREEHLESEHIFVKKGRFDILEKIGSTLEKLVETNKDKQFRLITKLENLYINIDGVKFFQALHNLVSNSIKFTPEGGQIDIMVEELEDHFTITVKDSGIGIPDDLKAFLFQKNTGKGRIGLKGERSVGMGLPVAKKLVDLMGGELWFESVENRGTAFFVRLPKE
ncbi:HAMP domain-containing histidine kinase [Fulvivirgaceae bacterium PWU5]|uniref:histidine kinase n=1 Tax=Dawidia cretensis TaxID=2782350 RepID=A0AAP2GRM0_9BACT|nr:HAMP domain-containing sensor histidine kinase [Dawidia cretensis]MBT1710504.1 HAMP domain-containing histidine kinase [Dawidia cretensis]